MIKHIGFVSTRFSGTDGVSLEACKWADVFEQNGHRCFWFAGEIDRDVQRSFFAPEAHFKHEQNRWINEQILGTKQRTPQVTQAIHDLRSLLKVQLHEFIDRFNIDLLIAENVLTIPMHVPFGLALTETIAETQLPTISHNHDFFWERVRFSRNAVSDYLRMAFPPGLPNIKHVVINSEAQEQLALRTGVSSTIIPNVLNFETPPNSDDEGILAFRESIGLAPADRMILQPTRIVKRKGIESAIELVKELDDPRNKLVISHEAGDEGLEYAEWLKDYACEHGVDLRLISGHISDPWTRKSPGKSGCTLWDVYPYADFITYPSRYEGFGNAFLEAIYFKKPLLINRYSTFVRDIEPLGFDLATMDGYLSKETVREVRNILESSEKRQNMGDHNYRIATRHYSYRVLRGQLNGLLGEFFGEDVRLLREHHPVPRADNILHIDPRSMTCKFYNSENCQLKVGSSS